MRRISAFLIFLFLFIFLPFSVAFAQDGLSQEEYENELSSYDLSFFENELDGDTYSMLEELGIENFDIDSVTSLSLSKVAFLIFDILSKRVKSPLEGISVILIYIILASVFQSLKSDTSDMSSLYSSVSALTLSLVLIAKVSPSISLACASIKIASNFVFAFIPVFCAIVAASGGITTSFSTNTLLLTMSQGLSFLSSNIFIPVINCFLAFGICCGIRAELQLQKVIEGLKKGITSALSFSAGVFVSVLSIKTTLATKADELGLRSVRFVLNTAVPVVGGALSEGLVSIQSYSSLIKSSVGLVGVIAIALVFLPAIIETLLWRFALFTGLIICDVFCDKSVSLVLEAFGDTMLLINVVLIVSMLTSVVSFGIIIAAGG